MEISYRPINISDAFFLAQYAAECDKVTNKGKISKIEKRLGKRFDDPNYLGFVALAKDERIGFQDGTIINHVLELNELYVKQEYRSRGIGMDLLREMVKLAKIQRIKGIAFYTEPGNVPMKRLANKAGFTLVNEKYLMKIN